ncbi:MAG: hydratase [Clostridia bacterium]|nr:hydratase [Clostridia bacterium]
MNLEKITSGVILQNGAPVPADETQTGRQGTIAYGIVRDHLTPDSPKEGKLKLRFDALASHDITYVGIVQTARASGLKEFPVPYVLTNCHNSLCAVGGTINEDDHRFGLSAAVKYGGIYVPPHEAVIHQYMREMMAGCGKMIIGSDSHTRYGALGTMAVGEGGPELVKQLLKRPYEVNDPKVVCIYMTGSPKPGVGPQDVALAIIRDTFKDGFVKNCVMEFVGPGVANLSVEYRIGIDVMTTETTCWSSIWETDEQVKEYMTIHGREDGYRPLKPAEGAYYDACLKVDLSQIEPMIALPFHPSNAYTIREFLENAPEILAETEKKAMEQFGGKIKEYKLTEKFRDGKMYVDQGVIAGCSGGTFENICYAANLLRGQSIGNGAYSLSVYPASQPISLELTKNGALADLMTAGATIRTAFCGPCFGAGDVPSNNAFSIRHTTRNFPNREGSKPGEGQISWVALMDARSIAATSLNGGILTPATDLADQFDLTEKKVPYTFDKKVYENRLYFGYGKAKEEETLHFGPNIADWPKMDALHENMLLEVACVIDDPVTTTDELIPSGETSSYRSNPLRLAEFALSRKDPGYVGKAKNTAKAEQARREFVSGACVEVAGFEDKFAGIGDAKILAHTTQIGSVVCAVKPGDGSAREQAASCQKVLGGFANIAEAYATKRYRSNLINWGMIPFTADDFFGLHLEDGDRIMIPGIRKAVEESIEKIPAKIYRKNGNVEDITLTLADLSGDERKIIMAGSLINYYNS